jgi:hypothetical protein
MSPPRRPKGEHGTTQLGDSPASASRKPAQNRYLALVERIFFARYHKGARELPFVRAELEQAAADLGIPLPKNPGNVLYAQRFRSAMPERVLATQPTGHEWIIELAGRAKYKFSLTKKNRIVPNPSLLNIGIPTTPQKSSSSTSSTTSRRCWQRSATTA